MHTEEKLGQAPVGRLLWSMSTQAGISLVLYSLFTLTDTLFLARGVSATAAGAVSAASPLLLLLSAVSTTVGAGGASVISRALGERDEGKAAVTAAGVFQVYWMTALAVTVMGLLLLEPLLKVIGAEGEMFPYARDYSRILLLGAVTATGFSSLIRAEGNARFSLYQWVVPVIVNLVLDGIFILVCGMGVTGAALGTVLGQLVSAGMSMWFFFRKKGRPYKIRRKDFKLRPDILLEVFSVGFPSFLQLVSAAASLIVMNRLLSWKGGAAAVTAAAFSLKLQNFFLLPQNGIVQGLQPIVGYNYTGGRLDRVKRSMKLGMWGGAFYGALILPALLFFGRPLLQIFTDQGELLDLGVSALLGMSLTFPLKGIQPVVMAYFQAIGRKREAAGIILAGTVIRLAVMAALGCFAGVEGVFMAFAAVDVLSGGIAYTVYRIPVKRKDTT